MSTTGNRIKALREALGLTQKELAKRSGLKQAAISHIERGRSSRPMNDTVSRIAPALGVTMEELVGTAAPSNTMVPELEAAFRRLNESDRKLIVKLAVRLALE